MTLSRFLANFSSNSVEIDIYSENQMFLRTKYNHYKENNKNYIGFYDRDITEVVKFNFDSEVTLGEDSNIWATDILNRKLELYFFKMELVRPHDYFIEKNG